MSNEQDDRDLQRYLGGGSDVSRAYAKLPHDEPGDALDERILAAARAEAARPRRPAWMVPTALAATLMLALSLSWQQLRAPTAGRDTPSESTETMRDAAAPPAASDSEREAAGAGQADGAGAPQPSPSLYSAAPSPAGDERPATQRIDTVLRNQRTVRPTDMRPSPVQDEAAQAAHESAPEVDAQAGAATDAARPAEPSFAPEARSAAKAKRPDGRDSPDYAYAGDVADASTAADDAAYAPAPPLRDATSARAGQAARGARGGQSRAPASAPDAELQAGADEDGATAKASALASAADRQTPHAGAEDLASRQAERQPLAGAGGSLESAVAGYRTADAPPAQRAEDSLAVLTHVRDDPKRVLDAVRDLHRDGAIDEAEALLGEFRERYPDYPLPDDFPLADPLPGAPERAPR